MAGSKQAERRRSLLAEGCCCRANLQFLPVKRMTTGRTESAGVNSRKVLYSLAARQRQAKGSGVEW